MRRDRTQRHLPDTDLQLDPKNANRGTPRGTEMLAESLKTHGAGRSVLVDQHGTVIAGNKTVEQAKAVGLGIQVVDAAGDKQVVVRRTNLDLATDPDARALALADNRVGEINLDWDPALVEQLAADGVNLEPLWSPQERERLFGHGLFDGESEEDEVLEAPVETTIVRGDLFALGDHRLLCGDATDPADVSRLLAGDTPVMMATDPPYGVSYDPEWRVRAGGRGPHATGAVPNDDRVDWTAAFTLFPGHVVYVWHAGLHAGRSPRRSAGARSSCGRRSSGQAQFRPRARGLSLAARALLVRRACGSGVTVVWRSHAVDGLVDSESESVQRRPRCGESGDRPLDAEASGGVRTRLPVQLGHRRVRLRPVRGLRQLDDRRAEDRPARQRSPAGKPTPG